MKQLLLFLVATIFAIGLSAQPTIYWQEDFSAGQHGWTVNTTFCESFSGPEYGVWALTSGTIDATPVDLGDGFFRWSFVSPLEYSITFSDQVDASLATTYGTVYSRYTMSNDTLNAMIDGGAVVGDGMAFAEQTANGIVDWATNFELNGDTPAEMVRMIGTGQPTITYSNGGDNFTLTGEDGAVVLEFTKTADCGSLWSWSPNGNVGYGVLGVNAGVVIDSDTRTNGVMVLNTLFNNSQGDVAYNPGSPPYPLSVSELISPPIDISAAESALSLELSQIVRLLNPTTNGPTDAGGDFIRSSFAVSTDNGQTWSSAFDINEGLANNTTENNRLSLPIPTSTIGSATEIRIKFTFAADFWFWSIDDVAIVERTGYEMQANANFYAIASNVVTPASQVEALFWMADIQNNGGDTAENVVLNLTITNDEGTEVYNEDKEYGDIASDSLAQNEFFDEPLAAEFQLPGVYSGTYLLTHDSSAVDQDMTNESLDFEFIVSDTLFAKETGRTRGLAPSAGPSWYMGNSFYVPNGDGWYGRYVSFMFENADVIAANTGSVTIYLYESDGDVNGDIQIEGEELGNNGGALAFNEYQFDGTENQQLITIPISLDGEGVPLQDGKYYLLVIQYAASAAEEQVFISGSEQYDYSANAFIADSLMMPRYSNIVAIGVDDPSFNSVGFGGGIVPVVRMSIGNNPNLDGDAIVATNDILSADYQMSVFPNPADLEVKLELDMPEQLDVNVRLFDQTGRVIMSKNYDKLQHGVFTYDVSQLPAGTYLVQLSTAAGTKTEKVIVSH